SIMPELNTPAFSAAAGELKASVVAMSAAHGSAADLINPDNVMVAPWSSFGSPHTQNCRANRPPSRGRGDGGTALRTDDAKGQNVCLQSQRSHSGGVRATNR